MREIKFRGKTIYGKWIFGDLITGLNNARIHHSVSYAEDINAKYAERYIEEIVVPETVGQFTGLYSANFDFIENPNQHAYFGDIIRFCNTEGYEFIHAIEWDDKLCCITIGGRPYSRIYESGYFQPSKLEFEIIGNIHDNPELLKTE